MGNLVSVLYPTETHSVYKNCLLHETQLQHVWQTHDWPAKSVFCLCCITVSCLANGHMDLCKAVTLVHQSLWHAVWDHCRSCTEQVTGHPSNDQLDQTWPSFSSLLRSLFHPVLFLIMNQFAIKYSDVYCFLYIPVTNCYGHPDCI